MLRGYLLTIQLAVMSEENLDIESCVMVPNTFIEVDKFDASAKLILDEFHFEFVVLADHVPA